MRLIDADILVDYLESKKASISSIGDGLIIKDTIYDTITIIDNQPTAYDVENVVGQLEEKTEFLKDCTKYGNENAEQQEKSYSTMMMYEVADLVEDLIDIVKKGGEE